MPSTTELAALFFSALVSSTLFPGGSELLLLYSIQQGNAPSWCIAAATVGNVLGSMITYGMGYYGMQAMQTTPYPIPVWLQVSAKRQQQAERHFQRFGGVALLFAWLPVIGDPLCLVAGGLRFHFAVFIVLVLLGKVARYAAVVLLV